MIWRRADTNKPQVVQRKRGFFARWTLPILMGPFLTVGALAYLNKLVVEHPAQGPSPTILDFGRVNRPTIPLKGGDPTVVDLGNVPPPGEGKAAVRTGAAVTDPLLSQGQVDAPQGPPAFDVEYPRVTILDAVHFRAIKDKTSSVVALKGVTGPLFMEVCTDGNDKTWKCGARARAELARLVGPRSIGCLDLVPVDDNTTSADCYVGSRNLTQWMVQQGWADPIDRGDATLSPLYDEARAAKRGRFGLAPEALN
jgi:endonuclease YncB( thermonuclease family)